MLHGDRPIDPATQGQHRAGTNDTRQALKVQHEHTRTHSSNVSTPRCCQATAGWGPRRRGPASTGWSNSLQGRGILATNRATSRAQVSFALVLVASLLCASANHGLQLTWLVQQHAYGLQTCCQSFPQHAGRKLHELLNAKAKLGNPKATGSSQAAKYVHTSVSIREQFSRHQPHSSSSVWRRPLPMGHLDSGH